MFVLNLQVEETGKRGAGVTGAQGQGVLFSCSFFIIKCDYQLNVMRWDFTERNAVFLLPGPNYQSFGYDDILLTNLITGI